MHGSRAVLLSVARAARRVNADDLGKQYGLAARAKEIMNQRRSFLILLISIIVMLLIAASFAPDTHGGGSIVSPLSADRPTPTSEVTLAPESYMPAVLMNSSPLPEPTNRPTPP